jgi:hypothetical protein
VSGWIGCNLILQCFAHSSSPVFRLGLRQTSPFSVWMRTLGVGNLFVSEFHAGIGR